MSKPSSLKAKLVSELETEIQALTTALETKKTKLKDLQATADSVVELLLENLVQSAPAAPSAKKKKTKKRGKNLSKEAAEALKTGLLNILRKHNDWMKAEDLKAQFGKLANAGSRYNSVVKKLLKAKEILVHGKLRNAKYKTKLP